MKRRTITISLIVFAIALLFGIGYAAWTITRSDSGEATGNFTAYTVEDSGALEVANSDNQVTFGWADPSSSVSNPWLTYTSVNPEDLFATFTVTWSGGAQVFNLTHQFLYGSTETTPSNLLIGGPVFALNSAVNGVTVSEAGVLTFTDAYTAYDVVTIKVTYSFGSLFGNQNPYVFFNGKGVNDAAFTGGNYNNGSVSLSDVNTALGTSFTASATFADVANAALTKLEQIVSNGEGTDLSMKVTVAK